MTPTKLSLTAKSAFGLGDFGFNLAWSGTGLFLMYVYTDVFGVSPTVAGAVYALALVWDAITDPIMGTIADRTRTRWGRYRPWIAVGALPLGASYSLAFWNPGLTGVALVAWIAFTHCLLRTCYTVANIPFSAMQARLTSDANERAALAGYRMVGAGLGALTIAVLTPLVIARFAGGDEARGYLLAGMAAGTLAVLILAWIALVLREPPETEAETAAPVQALGTDMGSFFAQFRVNTPLLQVFLVMIVMGIAQTMFSKNILYYFKYVLEAPERGMQAFIVLLTAAILTIPVWVVVANRTSKRQAWMISAAIAAIGYLAFFLNPSREVNVALAIIALIAVGVSAFGVLSWSMLPDTVEWGQAMTGVRHEAKVFGFSAFAQKAALGFNALLLGITLDAIGFDANVVQSEGTRDAIVAIMSLVPFAGVLISMAILWTYPIDAARHAEVKRIIDAKKGLP